MNANSSYAQTELPTQKQLASVQTQPPASTSLVSVRALGLADHDAWLSLWQDYQAF